MVATASTPSPAHHALSASVFTSATIRDTMMGMARAMIALLGFPSIVATLASASMSHQSG